VCGETENKIEIQILDTQNVRKDTCIYQFDVMVLCDSFILIV
jgi:hypothetical protein